jgi:hypothetical protein
MAVQVPLDQNRIRTLVDIIKEKRQGMNETIVYLKDLLVIKLYL